MTGFSRYSRASFDALGLGSSEARTRSAELAQQVLARLDGIVRTELERIVAELNEHGHVLTSYEDPKPGDYSYRDQSSPDHCRLRLACDIVISTGYGDTVEPGDTV